MTVLSSILDGSGASHITLIGVFAFLGMIFALGYFAGKDKF